MMELLQRYGPMLLEGTGATLVMVLGSTVCAYILGLPMGVQSASDVLIRYAYCKTCCLNMYRQDKKVGRFSANGYMP